MEPVAPVGAEVASNPAVTSALVLLSTMGIVVSAAISAVPLVESLEPQEESTEPELPKESNSPKHQYFDRSQYYLHPPSQQARSTINGRESVQSERGSLKTVPEHPESDKKISRGEAKVRSSHRAKKNKKTVTIDEGRNISRADSRAESRKLCP